MAGSADARRLLWHTFALSTVLLCMLTVRLPSDGTGAETAEPTLERALAQEPRPVSVADARGPIEVTAPEHTRFSEAVERWRPVSRDATRQVQHATGVTLEEDVVLALVAVESAGKPTARSAAGAVGLTQVMPSTFEELRARYSDRLSVGSLEEPRVNVLAGALYLADCARALEADLTDAHQLALVLHAYNMGPRAAAEWRDSIAGRHETDAGAHLQLGLPIETVEHASRILAFMQSSGV
jgi:soluble lytic murein transglycosylase-like protein